MPEKHWSGAVLPGVGDDLLGAWGAYTDSIGVVIPAQSIAAARAMLTKATQDGATISESQPAYFEILGNMYKVDGRKTADGVFILHAMGEADVDEQNYRPPNGTWSNKLEANQFSGLMASKLVVRPYARRATVFAGIYGNILSGHVDLAISAQGKLRLFRLDTGDAQSVSGMMQVTIPAGEAPAIYAGVRGGSGGGRPSLSNDIRFNYLEVTAVPITQA